MSIGLDGRGVLGSAARDGGVEEPIVNFQFINCQLGLDGRFLRRGVGHKRRYFFTQNAPQCLFKRLTLPFNVIAQRPIY